MNKLNEQNQKIWNYLQNNHFVARNLFFYWEEKNQLQEIFFDDTSEYEFLEEAFKNTQWLYRLQFDYSSIIAIGINTTNQAVMTIADEGDIGILTYDFSILPYEFLSLMCPYSKISPYSPIEVFQKFPEFKQALDVYEKWCKSEGIILDPTYEFHDKNGNLLSKLGEYR